MEKFSSLSLGKAWSSSGVVVWVPLPGKPLRLAEVSEGKGNAAWVVKEGSDKRQTSTLASLVVAILLPVKHLLVRSLQEQHDYSRDWFYDRCGSERHKAQTGVDSVVVTQTTL